MRSRADVIGLFLINVVSFSRNVVLSGLSFSVNSVLKQRMLSVRAVYVLSSLQLTIVELLESLYCFLRQFERQRLGRRFSS
jgi:hypothetical protein